MKGKKLVIWVFAIMMIGGVFLSAPVFADDEPRVLRTWISFPGGGRASYDVNQNGCIQNFYNANGDRIEPLRPNQRPSWLVSGKRVVNLGKLGDSPCRQGAVIGIEGTPIEYWSWSPPNNYICIGAYDAKCIPPRWYQPCQETYPTCP